MHLISAEEDVGGLELGRCPLEVCSESGTCAHVDLAIVLKRWRVVSRDGLFLSEDGVRKMDVPTVMSAGSCPVAPPFPKAASSAAVLASSIALCLSMTAVSCLKVLISARCRGFKSWETRHDGRGDKTEHSLIYNFFFFVVNNKSEIWHLDQCSNVPVCRPRDDVSEHAQ